MASPSVIVTDPVLLETGTVKKVTDVLDEAGMPYEVFDNVKPNPPVECIQDASPSSQPPEPTS